MNLKKLAAAAFVALPLLLGAGAAGAGIAQAAPSQAPIQPNIQPKHAHPGAAAACAICKKEGVWRKQG